MSLEIPADVRRILEDSGWQPGRRVDISETVRALDEAGYFVVEPARELLSELLGLRLRGSATQVHFAPLAARGFGSPDSFACASWLGSPLTPVGEVIGDSLLLIDERGRMFAGYANLLGLLGSSPSEALTSICRGGRAQWERVGD